MKKFKNLFRILFFLAIISAVSCEKIIDFLPGKQTRHSWAVRALQKGMRIEYVSRLMGHASVKNTEIYAKILDCELDKAMEIFSE